MSSLFQLSWFFIIYSFLGWTVEVSYQTIKLKKFINRGFLNGPWCPVYGFGMLSILLFLYDFHDNILLLFLGAFFLTSLLEFITGWALERIFNKKWWDYSDEPFNIKGYVALFFSLRWGLGVLLIIKIIHPLLHFLVGFLDNFLGHIFLVLILFSLAADLIVTVFEMLNIQKNFIALDEIADRIEHYSDEMGLNIFQKVSQAIETREDIRQYLENHSLALSAHLKRYESLRSRRSYIQRRLESSYPSLLRRLKR